MPPRARHPAPRLPRPEPRRNAIDDAGRKAAACGIPSALSRRRAGHLYRIADTKPMASRPRTSRPIRVLHILDCLRAGGLERAVWDLVRLADRSRITPRVVTACAESAGDALAAAFRDAGVYSPAVRRLGG